jgi:hypothetical protein
VKAARPPSSDESSTVPRRADRAKNFKETIRSIDAADTTSLRSLLIRSYSVQPDKRHGGRNRERDPNRRGNVSGSLASILAVVLVDHAADRDIRGAADTQGGTLPDPARARLEVSHRTRI